MRCPKYVYENPAETKSCGNCAAPLTRMDTPPRAERSSVLIGEKDVLKRFLRQVGPA